MGREESRDYLTKQIITYIGNKRELLKEIEKEVVFVCKELNKEKLVCLDLFSGSGVVARFLKQYSSKIIANDLEGYSKVINECFLSNKSEFDKELFNELLSKINILVNEKPIDGIIRNNYSPKDDKNIKEDDRAFYTNKNATFIDSFRHYIDVVVPDNYKKYFLALLLTEASVHVNTCGVFKGFYKDTDTGIGKFGGKAENALNRIKGDIKISEPFLSNFESEYNVFQEDANKLASELKDLDLVYLDPPYNQHPYGSNYFMLNIILKNKIEGKLSKVSGIPDDWNHSIYNKKQTALNGMKDIISKLDTKYVLISYNNEGFITYDEMKSMLHNFGDVIAKRIKYNTFRGSRNLRERNIHTNEFLFLLKKEKWFMAFGDVLKRNIHNLSEASEGKNDSNAFWIILRDIAVMEIMAIYPQKVDSDIAVDVYYNILSENSLSLPPYFKQKLKSNKQERFRVINRNMWTSNAFHAEGLANQPSIKAYKELNPYRKGEKIVYQGIKKC